MSYQVKVRLGRVIVRDRESTGPYDTFYVTGMLLIDGVPHLFEAGPAAANETIAVTLPVPEVFDGPSDSRDIGLILRGYDIDDNDEWAKRRRSIIDTNRQVAEWLKKIPGGGDVLGSVLKAWPEIVDTFVELDSNDVLISHRTMVHLPEVSGSYGASPARYQIDIRGTGDTIVSDWDYTVPVVFEYLNLERGRFDHKPPKTFASKRDSSLTDWLGDWRSAPKSIETKDVPLVRCLISRTDFDEELLNVTVVENIRTTKERTTYGVEITRAWHIIIASTELGEEKKSLVIGKTVRESLSMKAKIVRVLEDPAAWELTDVSDGKTLKGFGTLPDYLGAAIESEGPVDVGDPDLLELNDDAVLEMLTAEPGGDLVLRYRRPTGPHAMKVLAPVDQILHKRR